MKILLLCFLVFLSFNLYAYNQNCELPSLISNSYDVIDTKGSNINEANNKPRVYYNFPESNLGFVNEKLENSSPLDYNYKKVSSWIDSILAEMFDKSIEYSFFRGSDFNYELTSHTNSAFKNKVNNPDWYSCKGNIECQKYKTGFSDLARDIKDAGFTEDGNFTVIVSDLFIDEQEIGGNNSSIQRLFESTFENNKSIGIYGIKSKFNGNMYNIPNTQVYDKATSRPFFVVTIGDKNDVLNFKKLLDRDALKNVGSEDKNFTIFTSDLILKPINPMNIDNNKFKINNSLKSGIKSWEDLKQLKKFTVARKKSDSINISFDLSKIQLPDTILFQNLEVVPSVWRYKESNNKAECWIEIANKDIVSLTQNKNMIDLELFGKNKLKKLKPKEIYIINIKVYANDLGVSEEDFWMSEWNLNISDVNKVTTTGEQDFPVLNLLKLMRKLDDIQTDEFKRPNRDRALPIEFNIAMELIK